MGSEIDVVQANISKLEAKLDAGIVPDGERIFVLQRVVELQKEKNILLQGGPTSSGICSRIPPV